MRTITTHIPDGQQPPPPPIPAWPAGPAFFEAPNEFQFLFTNHEDQQARPYSPPPPPIEPAGPVPTQEGEEQEEDPADEDYEDKPGGQTYYRPKGQPNPNKKKSSSPPVVDPYASGFLRQVLGQDKYNTFSSRLFERRLVGPRGKTKGRGKGGKDSDASASVIDFLVKAEAVKEVLRTYVPHPYNPHKTLSHPYPPAPTGHVTLSRSTVLALSGWSNTQFSYWARRSEAISVLSQHDARLRSVAVAFEARLRGDQLEDEAAAVEGITGKGLDAIVDEVKERTGASQFLRGKHSSLDAFGLNDPAGDIHHRSLHTSPLPPHPATTNYEPTFQVQWYPTSGVPGPIPPVDPATGMPIPPRMSPALSEHSAAPASPPFPAPPPPGPPAPTEEAGPSRGTGQRYPARSKRAGPKPTNGARPENSRIPTSDSRSEVETARSTGGGGKRKASGPGEAPKKRIKHSEA